jgi:hypothetical protein
MAATAVNYQPDVAGNALCLGFLSLSLLDGPRSQAANTRETVSLSRFKCNALGFKRLCIPPPFAQTSGRARDGMNH